MMVEDNLENLITIIITITMTTIIIIIIMSKQYLFINMMALLEGLVHTFPTVRLHV